MMKKKCTSRDESKVKRIPMSTTGELFREIACKSLEKSDAPEIGTIKIWRFSTGRIRIVLFTLILQRHSIVMPRRCCSIVEQQRVDIDCGAFASLRRTLSSQEALWPVAHPYPSLQMCLFHPSWISSCVTKEETAVLSWESKERSADLSSKEFIDVSRIILSDNFIYNLRTK